MGNNLFPRAPYSRMICSKQWFTDLRRNEPMVFCDITLLIVPSAECCYQFGFAHLEHVREELNTLWTKCICLAASPHPKPDFAVGLKASVFTRRNMKSWCPILEGLTKLVMLRSQVIYTSHSWHARWSAARWASLSQISKMPTVPVSQWMPLCDYTRQWNGKER